MKDREESAASFLHFELKHIKGGRGEVEWQERERERRKGNWEREKGL